MTDGMAASREEYEKVSRKGNEDAVLQEHDAANRKPVSGQVKGDGNGSHERKLEKIF